MIIDTSVLIHIAFEEAGWRESVRFLSKQPRLALSAVSLVEAHAVIKGRRGEDSQEVIGELLETLHIKVISFDAVQADAARLAYSQFGKGQGHPAQLNFGDVVVYALASTRNEVLAFVGDDFGRTDLISVELSRSEAK